jgi:Domain of unknown function (DUF4166)
MTQHSLFRTALGAAFDTLAPALKAHYDLRDGQQVTIEGQMTAWNRYPLLRAFIPFMAKPGKDLRVVVHNRGMIDRDLLCYEWDRRFYYPDGEMRTYTLTRPWRGPGQVLDTFNQPANIGVVLGLSVEDGGRVLRQVDVGEQFAISGTRLLAMPGLFHVRSVATERAIDDQTIETEVVISHALLGKMFGYHGRLRLVS